MLQGKGTEQAFQNSLASTWPLQTPVPPSLLGQALGKWKLILAEGGGARACLEDPRGSGCCVGEPLGSRG